MARESKKQAAGAAPSGQKTAAPTAADIQAGLFRAVAQGNLAIVFKALHLGANPNLPNAQGQKPMDIAMDRHDYDTATLLLQAGALPPAYDGDPNGPPVYDKARFGVRPELENETALTYYIKNAHGFDAAFRALANGADVNKPNAAGHTPLAIAVSRKWPYAATQLVKLGAALDPAKPDPDEIIDTTTQATRLLAVIMEGRNASAVADILNEGADPNKADRHGLTPLALARALKWRGVEQMLLENGATEATFPDPNQMTGDKEDTPLLVYACSYQNAHDNYKQALLAAGANPDAQDATGKAAAHWCAVYGATHTLLDLEAAGANLAMPDAQGQMMPLHWACYNGRAHCAEMLLEKTPADALNAPTTQGRRLLHFAANRGGSAGIIAALVDAGAMINERDDKGETPLDVAVHTRDPALVRALLENGADTAKAEVGATRNAPLFTLVNSPNDNNAAIARLLLDFGADPNAQAKESINGPRVGDHLLYFAVSYRNYAVAEALLQAGADPHATDAKGESAMHHCLNLRQIEGVALLLKHGFDIHQPFEYTQKWHGGGETREEHHKGSALQEARTLVEKFGMDGPYGDMLRMLEEHDAKQRNPAPAAKPPKPSL